MLISHIEMYPGDILDLINTPFLIPPHTFYTLISLKAIY